MPTLHKCPICASSDINRFENQSRIVKFKTSGSIKNLSLEGLSFEKCCKCGEEFLGPEDLRLESQKIKELLALERKNKGLLTAAEIKEIREALEMTQQELEKQLGFSKKSFARWETYKATQSKAADLLLRAIKKGGKKFLDSLLAEQKPVKSDRNKVA